MKFPLVGEKESNWAGTDHPRMARLEDKILEAALTIEYNQMVRAEYKYENMISNSIQMNTQIDEHTNCTTVPPVSSGDDRHTINIRADNMHRSTIVPPNICGWDSAKPNPELVATPGLGRNSAKITKPTSDNFENFEHRKWHGRRK